MKLKTGIKLCTLLFGAALVVYYMFQYFAFYAADINLKDIDVKVIYHYEEDDYDFIGLHNRSRVTFEEGNFSLNPFYDEVLQEIADQDHRINYLIELENEQISSTWDEGSVMDVCLYEIDYWSMEKENEDALKRIIYFEFDSQLEVSTKLPMLRQSTDLDRRFKVTGEFEITGLYNQQFLDFHIKRLILFKLKYTTKEYLLGYHGYSAWNRYYMKVFNTVWYRYQRMAFNTYQE